MIISIDIDGPVCGACIRTENDVWLFSAESVGRLMVCVGNACLDEHRGLLGSRPWRMFSKLVEGKVCAQVTEAFRC